MADIVLSVASKVAEYLVAPVRRQCGYVISSDSHVRQLDSEVGKLHHAKERVQHSINEAENNMMLIEADVQDWLHQWETVADKARDLLADDGRAKKTCFYGWFPNPKARYRLVKDIEELIAQIHIDKVHFENPPPARVDSAADPNLSAGDGADTITNSGLVGGAPDVNSSAGDGGDTIADSRASIFQGIMEALRDEKLKVIGIYGPGGVGKTTLLEEVKKKLMKERRLFDMIVNVEVSQTPDLNNIQGQIGDALSLNLEKKQSQQGRRDLLFQRLQRDLNENVLIILDDLWTELDLKSVGIPSGDQSRGCKLLLASRYQDVLEQKMQADKTFRLEGLNKEEVFRLFEKIVGDKLKDEELKSIAAQLVEKLAGLPLLITSVASTLKYSRVSAWKNALIKIDKSNIETIVKLSFDHLESEEAKDLFLLCGLIRGTIRVKLLLGLGMGLGLFEGFNDTMEDSRDRLNTMLDSLRSVCLLQDDGDDMEHVTIHDLYRDVVVASFRSQNSLSGPWPKEEPEKWWGISLGNIGGDELAEIMQCMFPNLKIFMLSQPEHFLGIPVRRNDCCIVEDVAILGKLKALQILSFAGSQIFRLPKEIGELTNLRSLNLTDCDSLNIIEPGVLKGLINLEELYMMGSYSQWTMGEVEIPSESCNARLAELKNLTKLASLEILICNPKVLLEDGDLPFGNLTRFWIEIGYVHGRRFKSLRTMQLNLEECDSILSKEWVQKTLQKTQYLHLDRLEEFRKNAHELCIQGFTQLKHLDIQNSPSIKYIVSSSNDLLTAFTILESLFLKNLINLEKICNGAVALDCFSKLKIVRIEKCHRLKNLWFLSERQRLVHLEDIEIHECDSLEAIITDDAGKGEVATDIMVELPNIRRMDLRHLSNMTSFCTGAEGAPIQIEESKSTSKSILKLVWILKLPNLKSMNIKSSQSTEVVFDLEELKVIGDVKILSQLTELALRQLPNLQCMWKQDVKLQGISIFRNLKELSICETGLSFLFLVSVAKCLREIRDIKVDDYPNMKTVIVDDEGRDGGTNDIIEFPLLKRLSITCCPTEKFFSYPHGKKESVATTLDSQDACSDSFFDQKVSLPSLEELELKSEGSFKGIWHSELMENSFYKLATLSIGYCPKLHNVFPFAIIGRLHNLTILEIENCPSLESLFDCGSLDANTKQTTVLPPELEVKTVREAGKMKCIVKSDSQMIMGFPNLQKVHVCSCSNLRYLFPNCMATTLEKLESLSISNCEHMKEVVPKEMTKGDDESSQPLFNEKVIFRNIRKLKIEGAKCKELWSNKISNGSFCKLEYLRLEHCDNLLCIAPSNMWKKLQLCLDFLEVRSCRLIEIIYESDGTDTKSGKLRRLILSDLENLRHIWQSDGLPNVPFPNLRYVEAVRCSRLEMLFTTFTAKFLGQIKELVLESCENIKLIAGHKEYEEATGRTITFSELTALRLFNLPKFRSISAEFEFPSLEVLSINSCGTLPDRGLLEWESHQSKRKIEILIETMKYKIIIS
ncbi:hypothetical protein BT93_G0134 [Corymbia citriodora subsp. variegata]|nr:hypothetical protein BT93_G0134 [Corymbia citriodora subsp. variegata]